MEIISIFAPQTNQPSLMKSTYLTLTAIAALLFTACGPSEAEMMAAKEKATADSLANAAAMEHSFAVDAASSSIQWKGVMLGVKEHFGTISVKEGKFSVKGGQVSAGSFVFDMTSIAPLDTNYAPDGAKQGTRAGLVGHLMSPDFFDVANHPTAMFEITSVEGNSAKGNLTVRGTTNEETVTDIVVSEEGGVTKASGKISFDRQKYGVAFSTGAKDMVINDKIELTIALTAQAAM